MSDIRITPAVQITALLALVGGIGAAIVVQLPEIRRYLKIEAM